jgi:hypothetical protein
MFTMKRSRIVMKMPAETIHSVAFCDAETRPAGREIGRASEPRRFIQVAPGRQTTPGDGVDK